MIGYWLLQALQNALPGREVAALITQTLVSVEDPAFAEPTKFVGPVYDEAEAKRLAAPRVDRQARRTVLAPGSAIPGSSPHRRDRADPSALRRRRRGCVLGRWRGPGHPQRSRPAGGSRSGRRQGRHRRPSRRSTGRRCLAAPHRRGGRRDRLRHPGGAADHRTTPASLRAQPFPAGSMGPKVHAVCRFVELTGRVAAIGALADAAAILAGTAGTVVTATGRYRD